MKFINFPMVKFAVCLAAGIYIAHTSEILLPNPIAVLIGVLLILLFSWIITRKQLIQNPAFGSIVYLCFFFIGFSNYQNSIPENIPTHYVHGNHQDTYHLFQIKITQKLKPDRYNNKYIARLQAINGTVYSGKLLVSIAKDSTQKKLQVDNEVLINSRLTTIQQPLNPDQFNYATYMESLDVYGQIRAKTSQIITYTNGTATLTGIAERLRTNVINQLNKTAIPEKENAIIQALVLGQKAAIDKETMQQYAAAGAIHILAVSGLHVGVIYALLSWLFGFIKRLRYGFQLHSILIIGCLWGFAFITGLSPSVTRAVTMFSCVAFATLIRRRSNTISTLFISFLILLLYNPKWLFAVGFQLSYLAVFFIVWIQPLFTRLYNPRNYWKRLFYQTATVSISAQIGVIPLSLYYFHQLPGLFLVTNIIVLPLLSILLGVGIIITLLSYLEWLFDWMAVTYSFCIGAMNTIIAYIADQEYFLITNISFSSYAVLGSYVCISLWIIVLKKYTYKRLFLAITSCCLLVIIFITDTERTSKNRLIIFQKSKQTIVAAQSKNSLQLLRNDSVAFLNSTYPIHSFRNINNITTISEDTLSGYFKYNNTAIIVIDSSGVYPDIEDHAIVLVTQSPKLNLDRMINRLKPKQIIADGSNYTTYVNRWRETCKKRKLPFHHTGTKGAFIVE